MLEDNWIPIGEKLPEIIKDAYSKTVLVSTRDDEWDEDDEHWGLDKFSVQTAYLVKLSNGAVVWKSGWDTLVEENHDLVTHWMPLPKPVCAGAKV
jgi:hypothetical protein